MEIYAKFGKVKFKPNNNILYVQDFNFHRGLPSGIEFDVDFETSKYLVKLTAPGFGYPYPNYGNGSIHIKKDQLNGT